jgi:hypothetical protein
VSTSTINGSAYPVDVEDLLPAAVDLAISDDRVPSVNRLRNELKIGYDKARELHKQLTERAERWDAAAAGTTGPTGTEVVDEQPAEDVPEPQVTVVAEPVRPPARKVAVWPLYLLALPASVAIWSGWVGLGGLTGFGVVHPLPGLPWGLAKFQLNSAITLPIGFEAYAAYALRYWFGPDVPARARRFARWSAISSMVLGCLGQVAYHLMTAAGYHSAPWPITTVVACLPVGVLGMGAALAHLLRTTD